MTTRIRAIFWVGTLNHPGAIFGHAGEPSETVKCAKALLSRLVERSVLSGFRFQLERGEEGTLHLQAFFQCVTALSLPGLKLVLEHPEWHLERAHHPSEAWDYSGKEETRILGPYHEGSRPTSSGQGRRSDLEEATQAVISGVFPRSSSFVKAFPCTAVRHLRGMMELYAIVHGQPRYERPRVVILFGASGNGKTYRALFSKLETAGEDAERGLGGVEVPDQQDGRDEQSAPSPLGSLRLEDPADGPMVQPACTTYFKNPGKWWDNYQHQQRVVFNDFDPVSWECSWNDWKRLTDWCPVQYECKGGVIEFNSREIIVTSNSDPRNWWAIERQSPGEDQVWNNRDIAMFECIAKDEIRKVN